MRLFRTFSLCLLLCAAAAAQDIEHVRDFGENPGKLRMFRYVPENLDPDRRYPLVLVLHGSMLSARSISRCGGWNKLADSLGILLVYPDQPLRNNLMTAFSFFSREKTGRGKGESASIRQMIAYMAAHYPLDTNRVFITGLSAGGAMANVMLNEYPDCFSAGVLIAAPGVLPHDLNPDTGKIRRVAVVQGTRDRTVHPGQADILMEQWTVKFGLDPQDTLSIPHYAGNPLLSAVRYPREGTLRLLRLNAAKTGHVLLIDPGDAIDRGGTPTVWSKDIDFHLPYWIMEFFGISGRREP